ncbi:MAG: GreA/GreB family elongation factor [Patescibacteria group bacterium]
MTGKIVVSRAVFERLMASLVELEENEERLYQTYYPELSEKRRAVRAMLDGYRLKMSSFLQTSVIVAEGCESLDCLPFVVIGSRVTLRDDETGDDYAYKINHPWRCGASGEDVSYLSPLGGSLLLKGKGDKVDFDAPGGRFRYTIQGIELV